MARLDAATGEPWFTDAVVVAGSASVVADQIAAWHELGYAGVRLRPATPARRPDADRAGTSRPSCGDAV